MRRFDTNFFWAMRWNDFALANAVLRAVPDGHSRKSFHRRAFRKSSQGLDRKAAIPIARQKFSPFFLRKQQMFINFAEAKQ